MTIASLAVLGALTLLAAFNVVSTYLTRRMLRHRPPLLEDAECPPGMVLLCLRGGDPFLERSLRRLFDQDYPNYRVRIVLDSAGDSAREFVDRVIEEVRPPHVEVLTLGERFQTCTYKMSGILWGTREIPPGVEFVALMDGDTVPHRSWLRELATPLVRDGALCCTGNRWYFPARPTLGSMVRVAWGAGALIMMSLFRIPWGGTMAFRRSVIADERLRDRIRHAFSEDTTIGQFVNDSGSRVEIDPRLMIVNYEEIAIPGFFNFDTRQLLAVKMQHRRWPWVALYGVVGLPMLAYPLARLCGWSPETAVDIGFGVYFFSYASQVVLFAPAIRGMLRTRNESLPGWNLLRIVLGLLAMPLTQLLHLAALVRACTMRHVVWRGVTYRLGKNPPLQVVGDNSKTPPQPASEALARSA